MPAATVLVTNTTTDIGLAAVKALAAAGYRVVTVDFPPLPFGLRSRYSAFDHSASGLAQTDFEERFLDLLRRVRPDVFLPIDTRCVYYTAKHIDTLPAETAVNVPSLDGFMAAYIKSLCASECLKLGIACPRVYSFDEALRFLKRERDARLVVKPDCDIGVASGVRFGQDGAFLTRAVAECEDEFGQTLIQEYIPGGPEAMKTVVLLFSRESRLAAAFTTRKIRQWPETGGLTVASCSTDEVELVRQVVPFFEKWRWRGPAEVEMKFDSRDGRHKVIEINPRFPAYLRFPIECGLNLPVMAARLALGADAEDLSAYPAYTTGARFLNPTLFVKTLASGFQRGGPPELWRSLRNMRGLGPAVGDIIDDPLPRVGRALRKLGQKGDPQRRFHVPGEELRHGSELHAQ